MTPIAQFKTTHARAIAKLREYAEDDICDKEALTPFLNAIDNGNLSSAVIHAARLNYRACDIFIDDMVCAAQAEVKSVILSVD